MPRTIVADFRLNGTPQTGLSPTILIWQVDSPDVLIIDDDDMSEIGNGFYKYIFTDGNGFDPREDFVYQADGTASITNDSERFVTGACCAPTPEENADGVWEANKDDYTDVNTMGGRANATFTNVEQLLLDVADVEALVELVLKFHCNRTRIDTVNKTLTVFDNDGVTPIKVFELKDGSGAASVEEVCERDPV